MTRLAPRTSDARTKASSYLARLDGLSPASVPALDFHLHTTWTDGTRSAAEMHACAVSEGLEAVLFSEHARKSSGDWFPDFAREIRQLPDDRCVPLVGVETKVEDSHGRLDTTDAILAECDLVMAAVHRFPGSDGSPLAFDAVAADEAVEMELELALGVLDNPAVDILAHPFGMSLRRFKRRPDDGSIKRLASKAADTGVALEINPRYHPDPWRLVSLFQEGGARVSLGSNAHCLEEVGRVVRVLRGEEEPWSPGPSELS